MSPTAPSAEYVAKSSVGWLDLDSAASERVGVMLRALEEPSTLDPLGLGSIRDAFATMLSPGTSTIQTRLRYFLFLPWIFRRLERDGVPSSRFAESLLDSEAQLIDCLRHLGPNQGVIGFTVGRELKRMPSAVFWGGLRSWGISRLDLSLSEYGKRAVAFARLKPERDDDGAATQSATTMWAAMPDAPEGFLSSDVTFDLPPQEAQLLVDHIRLRHPDSLLAFLSQTPEVAADAEFPWLVTGVNWPDHLREVLDHARCFSELTEGPQHIYNVMLARRARHDLGWETEKLETSELEALGVWASAVAERQSTLHAWVDELPAFWAFLPPDTATRPTREFVKRILTRAVDAAGTCVDDPAMHTWLTTRESDLKAKRARLVERAALEGWNRVAFGGQLSYRWPVTKSYLGDLALALGRAG